MPLPPQAALHVLWTAPGDVQAFTDALDALFSGDEVGKPSERSPGRRRSAEAFCAALDARRAELGEVCRQLGVLAAARQLSAPACAEVALSAARRWPKQDALAALEAALCTLRGHLEEDLEEGFLSDLEAVDGNGAVAHADACMGTPPDAVSPGVSDLDVVGTASQHDIDSWRDRVPPGAGQGWAPGVVEGSAAAGLVLLQRAETQWADAVDAQDSQERAARYGTPAERARDQRRRVGPAGARTLWADAAEEMEVDEQLEEQPEEFHDPAGRAMGEAGGEGQAEDQDFTPASLEVQCAQAPPRADQPGGSQGPSAHPASQVMLVCRPLRLTWPTLHGQDCCCLARVAAVRLPLLHIHG